MNPNTVSSNQKKPTVTSLTVTWAIGIIVYALMLITFSSPPTLFSRRLIDSPRPQQTVITADSANLAGGSSLTVESETNTDDSKLSHRIMELLVLISIPAVLVGLSIRWMILRSRYHSE